MTHWCSLQLRFDAEELALLRQAEMLYGNHLVEEASAEGLARALFLGSVGQKLAQTEPGVVLSLGEDEMQVCLEAARFAADQGNASEPFGLLVARLRAALGSFP